MFNKCPIFENNDVWHCLGQNGLKERFDQMVHHEINKSGSSSYPPESTSTPCRPQTPWWKSHPEDSGNHIDYRIDGTVDLRVWPTPDKLYLSQALTVTRLCERP